MPETFTGYTAPDPYNAAMSDPPKLFAGEVRVSETRWVTFTNDGKNASGKDMWSMHEYEPSLFQQANVTEGMFNASQVRFVIAPLDATLKFIEHEMGAKNRKSPEFAVVVRPSLELLAPRIAELRGVPYSDSFRKQVIRHLKGLWVTGEFVPRPKDPDWDTLKFTGVFATREECEQALSTGTTPIVETTEPTTDPQRVSLAEFLPFFWDQANKDPKAFLELIKANSMFDGVFDEGSPEVKALTDMAIPF